ncbi:MAG: Gldg family protein [Candidatus Schekmanbacteria bacterium]|nr:Gldg family protein [Candidatus Schekmanbacteria bacterium]
MNKRLKILRFNIVGMIFIILGIVVLINYLASQHNQRFDFTEGGEHTLADQSIKLLKKIDSPLKVILFDKPTSQTWGKAENLLAAYRYHSGQIQTELVDPDKKPSLAKQYGIQRYGTIFFEYKNRQEQTETITEEEFTNVILKLTREKQNKVYFVDGHGENNIDDADKTGYSLLKEAIEKQNFAVAKLVLAREAKIPDDCSVLIISGPEKDFFPEELKTLEDYLKRGGKAFFMLDPPPGVGLNDFLLQWGVKIGNDMVIDKLSRLFGGDYFMPVVTNYTQHPITRGFDLASFFPVARSITPLDNVPEGTIVQSLASTTEGSWAEVDYQAQSYEFNEGKDIKGPISVAVVVDMPVKPAGAEKQPAAAKTSVRLIVIGDADFVNNTYINLSGNRDLFLNIISWLAQEEDLISIRPKEEAKRMISLTETDMQMLFWLTVVAIPVAVLLAGIGVWWRRRKA